MKPVETTPEDLIGPFDEVEAKHAPKKVWTAGDTGLLRKGARVAVVGSRKASPEGLRRAAKLSWLLATNGIHVVSGLAEGVDATAHTQAVRAGGRTIAVLGTPLDRALPMCNPIASVLDTFVLRTGGRDWRLLGWRAK